MSRGPWMEAMETQQTIIERLFDPMSALHRVTLGFEESMGSGAPKAAFVRSDGSGRFELTMPEWQAASLTGAQTYWVSSEMLDVVDHAAQTLDTDEPMVVNDLPTPHGFALLERPIIWQDARGRTATHRALSWTTQPDVSADTNEIIGDGGVLYTLWTDTSDMQDEVNRQLAEFQRRIGVGRFVISHVGPLGFGRRLREQTPSQVASDMRDAEFNEHLDPRTRAYQEEHPLLPRDDRDRIAVNQTAWIRTFWRLIEQRVGHPVEERPDRATARRMARGQLGAHAPQSVTVVTLRRYSEAQPKVEGEDGAACEGIKWSHRWMVRGHWRNQWYASLQRHRQIWIAPFVKGPEEQPLLLKPKVYRWTR